MADTSFFGATGTTASTQNTIQTSVDAAAASASAATTAQIVAQAARDTALSHKNAAATSETNAAASAVTANQNAANTTAVANIASDVTAVAGKATQVGLLGTSDAIADMNTLGTSAIVADMGALADRVSQMALLGTSDAVADMNTLGTSAIVADMDALADRVSQMDLLGTSDAVSDMNTLGTSDVVSDMNTLGTSSNVTNMNTLAGIASNITTTAGIASAVSSVAADATDIGAVAGKETEIGLLGTSANITAMGLLGTSANVTAMSNVSGSISNVNTVASNLTSVNDFADKYRIGSSDPSSNNDEGDLFYNTGSNTLKVYTGSAWEQGVTAGSGFLPLSGGGLTGNITFSGSQTVDGRDLSVDGAKLDGIEASATADQTAAQIKTAYESNSDTNAFTDADHTKLDGIEASATADQTASEILTAVKTVDGASSGLDADLLDGQEGSYYLNANNFSNMPSGYSGWTVSDGSNSESIADGNTLTFSGATYDTSNNTVTITSQTANDFTDADHTKLDGIEASADVTDTANVTSAGAAMLSGATFTGAVTLTNAAPQVRLKDTDVNRQLDVTYGTRAVNFDNEMASGEDIDTVQPWTAFRFIDDSETREVLRVDTAKVTVNKPIEMGSQSVKFGSSKWAIVLDGNDLDFQYNGTTVFKLASNGAVTSANDITAFGSP
ncbi:beta strand repeat-containing protein [Candidatus Puniceispirillum marinum]|uniref:Uncharacterized protein n=1 Tax=Puniceispirillum marinum (strain IMCC1322) TaxID=488538 RepID=D5BQB5_PUNMI|nr:hypothetical protein [Candidatus Puniceispirillum marinum]ADE38613.1 hypothetical protein SAR116_0370 [Candidatus Puniceispirillum marinum IMCC1322]